MGTVTGICFAYYCSGHGFGHATRVSAFTSHLLSLTPQPTVHIVSSAPKHVFSDCIALGAHYKYSEIDPVIVQPLPYRVDRQKSIDVLKAFLDKKDVKLREEQAWLVETKVDCVLSDAAFLGCLSANAAGLPSILITNFTFDSVYSYLSAPLTDHSTWNHLANPEDSHLQLPNTNVLNDLIPDIPVPQSILAPLVKQIHAGFRCADLLVLLPGSIPIPSFSSFPALPSPDWIDWSKGGFKDDIISHLTELCEDGNTDGKLHDAIPFASASKAKPIPRRIMHSPLLVRSPTGTYTNASSSTSPPLSPYTQAGRCALLSSIGVPAHLHDQVKTKILVVSFGGQVFRRVGSRNSKSGSHSGSPLLHGSTVQLSNEHANYNQQIKRNVLPNLIIPPLRSPSSSSSLSSQTSETNTSYRSSDLGVVTPLPINPRLATHSHIFIPGAPPASKPPCSPTSPSGKTTFQAKTIPPSEPGTPQSDMIGSRTDYLFCPSSPSSYFDFTGESSNESLLRETTPLRGFLPDETWIAIVCGVSKEQWNTGDQNEDDGLPDGFYVAPKYIYMPDLTAIADVLLGKLGYGTVSECVDSCTPFVYVSRPLFIEEHGLRLLLSRSGVGVELSRAAYEAGEWAGAVEDAWMKGLVRKGVRINAGMVDNERRCKEGREMAQRVVEWVEEWRRHDYG